MHNYYAQNYNYFWKFTLIYISHLGPFSQVLSVIQSLWLPAHWGHDPWNLAQTDDGDQRSHTRRSPRKLSVAMETYNYTTVQLSTVTCTPHCHWTMACLQDSQRTASPSSWLYQHTSHVSEAHSFSSKTIQHNWSHKLCLVPDINIPNKWIPEVQCLHM